MSCRPVTAAGRLWRFCPDGTPAPMQRLQVLLDLSVTGELTGVAPEVVTVGTLLDRPGLVARSGPRGRAGLAGRPVDFLPPAMIAGTRVAAEVGAPGHLPQQAGATLNAIPPQPTHPVALHPEPVAIWGRVLDTAGSTPVPLPGATVRVVDFEPRQRHPVTNAPEEELLALAGGGLRAARAAIGPQAAAARRRQLLPDPQPYALLRGAGVGETVIRLSGRQGLAMPPVPGSPDILLIEPGDPERLEVLAVTAIEGALAADAPATVTLAHPLRRAHPEGTAVRRALPALPAPAVALRRPAAPADAVLLLADTSGFAGFAFVEVETPGGVPPAEHHPILPLLATTGPDGRFRLPALQRAARLTLEIAAVSHSTVQRLVDLGPGGPVLVEELRLP
jgi:hypothetical protein